MAPHRRPQNCALLVYLLMVTAHLHRLLDLHERLVEDAERELAAPEA